MVKYMMFGNELNMQMVPCPATGMSVSRSRYVESLAFQTGRKNIHGTNSFAKTFSMEFPVQEASGATGLDVFSEYASGFYGSNDAYPVYFADPMHYDTNLMPEHWASPGLSEQGWPLLGGVGAQQLFNLVNNPSVEYNTTGYSVQSGTGGTAAGTQASFTGLSGQFEYRATWSVATSAVSGGITYSGVPVTAGLVYSTSVNTHTSKTQRYQLFIDWINASSSLISTTSGAQTVLTGYNAPLTITNATAPALAVTANIRIAAVSGTSGTNWAAADFIAVDQLMMVQGSALPAQWFDGDQPGASWTGTVGSSASFKYIAQSYPTYSDATPGTNASRLPKRMATYTVAGSSTSTTVPDANMPYVVIPIPTGYVLWLGATGTSSGPYVSTARYTTAGGAATLVGSGTITISAVNSTTRITDTISSAVANYVKVWIGGSGSITLQSLTARLYPIGTTPTATGLFSEGHGHTGLKFEDNANTESYVLTDPNRPGGYAHLKGLSTSLTECG